MRAKKKIKKYLSIRSSIKLTKTQYHLYEFNIEI